MSFLVFILDQFGVFYLLRICSLLDPVLTLGNEVVFLLCPFMSPRSLNLFSLVVSSSVVCLF